MKEKEPSISKFKNAEFSCMKKLSSKEMKGENYKRNFTIRKKDMIT
jgi:hypothetical protein